MQYSVNGIHFFNLECILHVLVKCRPEYNASPTYCMALHCSALGCSAFTCALSIVAEDLLDCITLRWIVLQHIQLYYNTYNYIAVH